MTHKRVAFLLLLFLIAIFAGYIDYYHQMLENLRDILAHGGGRVATALIVCASGIIMVAYPKAFNIKYSPRFSQTTETIMTPKLWRVIGYVLTLMLFAIFEVIKSG
ncbi:MAG: hypothetical protein ACPG8A_06405 [Psychrobium sp.]